MYIYNIIIQSTTKNYVHLSLKKLNYCIFKIMLFVLYIIIIRYLVENCVGLNI